MAARVDQDVYTSIVRAHEAIRRMAWLLESDPDASVLLPAVEWLVRLLPDHFAAEEVEGGWLDHLASLHGSGDRLIADLRFEHAALLSQGKQLVAALRDRPGPMAVQRAQRWIEQLLDHESFESGLARSPEAPTANDYAWSDDRH